MKAIAVTPATQALSLIDHLEPVLLTPTQVKCRILEVGVCGTDKDIIHFEYGMVPEGYDYLIIGHEALGEVIEVGSAVSRVKIGDLVIPSVRRPCQVSTCIACRNGYSDFCYSGQYQERGIKEAHGFMTEMIVDEEIYFNAVPWAIRDVAVLIEPMSIVEKAITQVMEIQTRLPWMGANGATPVDQWTYRQAVVLGAGPVGILATMILVSAGFKVDVYSRSPKPNVKASLVESIGATYYSTETVPVDTLVQTLGSIDFVFEATGIAELAINVLEVLGNNAVFVFSGVSGIKGTMDIPMNLLIHDMVLKNQVIFGSVNANPKDFSDAIRDLEHFMQQWPDAVRALITSHRSIEDYQDVLLGDPGGIKNVISIAETKPINTVSTALQSEAIR